MMYLTEPGTMFLVGTALIGLGTISRTRLGKVPEPSETDNDKAFREHIYGRCPRHGRPMDECDCITDAQDMLEEMEDEN